MSSSTMHNSLAISLKNVSKIYHLHGCQRDQIIDVLGLRRLGFKPIMPIKEFAALSDISLDVPRGHRIGIIGRNGAGKTTLLKLICGNFTPTHGEVEVCGNVQALMNVGLGFHPEYTGRENVEASLQYNGLPRLEYSDALNGIIEFCELGEFLDQPFKSYSLGMQARLMFASATAIKPDILIVDEVLGAGDAYFVAKSKTRVEKLIYSGCTMLLVSHSMQQILELCDEAIWLDQGRIRMQGESFLVVKAYEEYLQAPIGQLNHRPFHGMQSKTMDSENKKKANLNPVPKTDKKDSDLGKPQLQEPYFLPHSQRLTLPETEAPREFKFLAPGGLCRWSPTLPGELVICGFTIVNEAGETDTLIPLRPAEMIFTVKALQEGTYSCRYSITIFNHLGESIASPLSSKDEFSLQQDETRCVRLGFNPLQLGPGEYIVSIVVLEYGALELLNSARRYDLLSRSFRFRVEIPSSWESLQNRFFHSAEWRFQ